MKSSLKSILLWDIKNSRFRKIFMRNWVLVFSCIVIPLFFGVFSMQRYSDRSLLREVDASIQRGADNTISTVKTLMDEACEILKKEITNGDVVQFIESRGSMPQTYKDVVMVRSVLELVKVDFRESLYHSVDVFSDVSDRIVSSLHRGQHYIILNNPSLKNTFDEFAEKNTGVTTFAAPRIAQALDGTPVRVITIYQTKMDYTKNGFVSISIDTEKLISHITSNSHRDQGTYLLIDQDGNVIMDTRSHLDGQVLDYLVAEDTVFPITRDVDDQMMRIGINDLGLFGWKLVQMVPVSELEANSLRLRNLLIEIVLFGVFAACFISYYVTCKLFRPIRSILDILENPSNQMLDAEERDEYRYLLVQILELFQKNITLESERSERIVALRSARAKTLQGQLTPHFLNNILQTINWIAIEETQKEHSRTSEAIVLLADVIRIGKEKKSNFTTVEEELAYTQRYMELETLRYGDGIRFHYTVDERIWKEQIPCISIQPLVENAIIHGLQPLDGEGDIYISVSMPEQHSMEIRVEDSGVGMKQDVINQIFTFMKEEYIYLGAHLGIVNLFQRYRLLYADSCAFEIGESQYGGAMVSIRIPLDFDHSQGAFEK